jgi:hypothetical protein
VKGFQVAVVTALIGAFEQGSPDVLLAAQQADALRPLTRCDFADGLRIVAADRAPAEIRQRQVMTARGPRAVSLADGYRVMLAYPGSDYFANVKIELSQEPRYPDDKDAIVDNMQYLANQSSREARAKVAVERRSYKGFDSYAVNFPTIDFFIPNNPPTLGGGPVGTYVLFDETRKVIVTVYFLNQRPERRRFKTIEEWRVLRDRFLDSYTTCLASSR